MVFLKEVQLGNNSYFFLFYSIQNEKFKPYIRYIGKKKPNTEYLNSLKKKFLKDVKSNPELFEKKQKKNVIIMLQEIQENEGYISEENIIRLSKEINIPATHIYGVLTFYTYFRFNPPGKYNIAVCNGTACHVKNSVSLIRYIENILDIKVNETTKDKKFSLGSVNCIGACAKAPAMMINNTVYGDLDEEKIKKILDGLE